MQWCLKMSNAFCSIINNVHVIQASTNTPNKTTTFMTTTTTIIPTINNNIKTKKINENIVGTTLATTDTTTETKAKRAISN